MAAPWSLAAERAGPQGRPEAGPAERPVLGPLTDGSDSVAKDTGDHLVGFMAHADRAQRSPVQATGRDRPFASAVSAGRHSGLAVALHAAAQAVEHVGERPDLAAAVAGRGRDRDAGVGQRGDQPCCPCGCLGAFSCQQARSVLDLPEKPEHQVEVADRRDGFDGPADGRGLGIGGNGGDSRADQGDRISGGLPPAVPADCVTGSGAAIDPSGPRALDAAQRCGPGCVIAGLADTQRPEHVPHTPRCSEPPPDMCGTYMFQTHTASPS